VCNQSPLGVLCIVPPQGISAREVVNRVLGSGKAWVSVATFERQEVIRACVTSGETTEYDVAVLIESLCLEDSKWTA
jgi:hypothetical protein